MLSRGNRAAAWFRGAAQTEWRDDPASIPPQDSRISRDCSRSWGRSYGDKSQNDAPSHNEKGRRSREWRWYRDNEEGHGRQKDDHAPYHWHNYQKHYPRFVHSEEVNAHNESEREEDDAPCLDREEGDEELAYEFVYVCREYYRQLLCHCNKATACNTFSHRFYASNSVVQRWVIILIRLLPKVPCSCVFIQ